MNLKRMMAAAMAAAMVMGNGVIGFAASSGGTSSTATILPHLNTEIVDVTLPTSNDDTFKFVVDPERLVQLSEKKLVFGGSTVTLTTADENGVYFANSGGSYSSTSDELKFTGKNSVDVDVTVKATVTTSSGDAIALVATEEALSDATVPSVLLKMKLGASDGVAITADGATVTTTISGQPDNFEAGVSSNAYTYTAKTAGVTWADTKLKLIGKANNKTVGSTVSQVPSIRLVWSYAKHVTSVTFSSTTLRPSANTITLTPSEGVSVSSAVLTKANGATVALTAGNQYTYTNGVITFDSTVINNNAGGSVKFTLNNGQEQVVSLSR